MGKNIIKVLENIIDNISDLHYQSVKDHKERGHRSDSELMGMLSGYHQSIMEINKVKRGILKQEATKDNG